MTITAALEWTCDRCQEPIADGDGIFWANLDRADAFSAHVNSLRSSGGHTVAELLDGPSPAPWRWTHTQCLLQEDVSGGRFYGVDVESLRSTEQLLWWAGHLFEKPWVRSSDLADQMQEWGSRR